LGDEVGEAFEAFVGMDAPGASDASLPSDRQVTIFGVLVDITADRAKPVLHDAYPMNL
jgi:hypothetical protein